MSKRFIRFFRHQISDEGFVENLEWFEGLVSRALSLTMVMVIIVVIGDLIFYLKESLLDPDPYNFLGRTLLEIFGLFLSVLIALEILENITAYLKKHVVQVELVIVTSLIAVARKIIILDLKSVTGITVIGLGIAVVSLSISYLVVKKIHS